MSLILEALSKAEQSNGRSNYGHAPQAYPLEKKATNKKTLLLLITIACLSSAIVTLLILYMMDSNNETSYTNTQKPTSTTAKETVAQRPASQATHHKVFVAQATPNNENLDTQREPGFAHLTSRHAHKNRIDTATNQPANTAQSNNKSIAPTPAVSKANLGTHKILDSTEAQYFSNAKNTQLADMEISVHLYSKTPTKRFVYINSTRYSENALISDGIVLYEITENGIILDVDGVLYRMPIKL